MRMNRKIFFVFTGLFTVLFLVSVQATFAGIVVEQVYGKKGQKQVSYFQANKVKTVSTDGEYTIMDLDKGTMIMVNPDKKEYSVMSLKEMVSSMQQGMQQIQDRLRSLPPEQRAMLEKMMGIQSGSHSRLALKDTGKTEKIAGYTAKKYVILKDGHPISEYWVSKELRQDILKEMDKSKIDDFEKAMNKISMESMPFAGSEARQIGKLELKIQKYGEIVKEIHHPQTNGQVVREAFTVVSVKKKHLPSSTFQIPAGYKQAESPVEKLKSMPSPPVFK